MVAALVKDAAYFISRFIDHHLELGARHILLIDNGSTDATVDIARMFDRVTIIRNTAPALVHETHLRNEISRRVAQGGWVLFADADELIELPIAGERRLEKLTGYCNRLGYTAVVGQMLDRFSEDDYSRLRHLDYDEAISAMDLYSLNKVKSIDYSDHSEIAFRYFLEKNVCDDPGVQFKQGGVRQELFNESPFLSKHPLVRNRAGIGLMTHPHCASGVAVADVTLLIHHYKLAGDWVQRDRKSVHERVWAHGEDRKRLATIGRSDDFRLTPAKSRKWVNVGKLLDEGFLYASSRFAAT